MLGLQGHIKSVDPFREAIDFVVPKVAGRPVSMKLGEQFDSWSSLLAVPIN